MATESGSKRLREPVAGFSFEMSRPQVIDRCRTAGLEVFEQDRTFPDHAPLPVVICAGLPAAPPIQGDFYQVELWFCADRPCAIKLVSGTNADYARIRAWAVDRYGEPQAAYEEGVECTRALHESTGCHLGAQSGKSANWFEGPPDNIRSMIKLSESTHAEKDYVFLWFTTFEATKYWR